MEAQLGLSLDKSLQCSSWGSRPLSPEQLQYAALDAAVLLMLLDSIIAAALPSRAMAAPDADSRHSVTISDTAPAKDTMDIAGAHAQLSSSEHLIRTSAQCSEVTCQAGAEHKTDTRHLQSNGTPGASSSYVTASQDGRYQHGQRDEQQKECSASGAVDTMRALASLRLDPSHSHDSRQEQSDASLQGRDLPSAASAAELQEAAQVWGIRLEVGGNCRQKPQKQSKDKRPGVREQFRQDSAGSEQIGGSSRCTAKSSQLQLLLPCPCSMGYIRQAAYTGQAMQLRL